MGKLSNGRVKGLGGGVSSVVDCFPRVSSLARLPRLALLTCVWIFDQSGQGLQRLREHL